MESLARATGPERRDRHRALRRALAGTLPPGGAAPSQVWTRELFGCAERFGSTAVPGLPAKPIIDVDVLLRSAGDLPRVILTLASVGYQHRGDLGVPGREAFRAPADRHPHHLYVCTGHGPYGQHIAFRDYLRSHPEKASAYAALKRKLALEFGADRDAYTNGKSEFIDTILCAAASEKALSNLDVPAVPGGA